MGYGYLSLLAELKLYEYFSFKQLLRLTSNIKCKTPALVNAINEKCPWLDQHIHPTYSLNRFSYILEHWTLPFPLLTLDSNYNMRCETQHFQSALGIRHESREEKICHVNSAYLHTNECDCFIYIASDDTEKLNEVLQFFLDNVPSNKTLALVRIVEDEDAITEFDHNMDTFNSIREDLQNRLLQGDVFDWRIWCVRSSHWNPTILKEAIQ